MKSNITDKPKTRIGVIIDDDIIKEFRQAVNQDGLSLSSVVNELMRWYLEKRPKSAKAS
jgi:metal-responsive CopG/Arc/MetJ family transcriptional regulator